MLRLFDICFKTGALFTVVTFILGQFFDFMDFGGEVELDLDGDLSGYAVTPFKPVVITAFITVFGGVGLMATNRGFNSLLAAVIALAVAFIVAFLFYRFIIVPLHKAQSTSAISQKELIGQRGKVSLAIKENAFGKITYTMGGNTYTAPAKSSDGEEIGTGEEVIIMDIQKNVYYVQRI